MSKDKIEKSYEAFGNLNLQTTSTVKDALDRMLFSSTGIGLGISTSYKIAKAMGGNLSIKSHIADCKQDEIEQGTTVTIQVECFEVSQSPEQIKQMALRKKRGFRNSKSENPK